MTRTSPPQVAFSSGEISPLLHRRFDYQRFQTGVQACRGFLPMAEGALTRAPGTWYRGRSHADAAARLVPFQFAADDAVVLEFTANRMRVWRYGALVMAGLAPYELATPYTLTDLPNLRWTQSADVLYLVDGRQPLQRLSRLALDNWTIAPQTLNRGPFRVQNLDEARTIQASAETGVITLTASSAHFTAAHVGSLMRLTPTDNSTIPLWQADEDLQRNPLSLFGWADPVSWGAAAVPPVTVLRRYGNNVYRLTQGNNSGVNPPIHESGEELTDNLPVKWRYQCDQIGIVRITGVTSPTVATATVLRRLSPAVKDNPTWRWHEGAWSDVYGYPSAIELYDQRLAAAASRTEPRTVWFSALGDFADFLDGTEADEAFAYTVSGSGSINRIVNLQEGRTGLHIFALGEEYSTRSESRAQVIGPTTAVFGRDGGIGSSPATPISPSGDPIFISRDRRRVHVVSYSLEADANRSKDLSRPSRHLGAAKFEEIVWQGAPLAMAWLRTGTGSLSAMVYDPTEEILGWATVSVAGGFVESLCITPSADGSLDVLTMVVRRVVNGATVRMIEEQAMPFGAMAEELPASAACHLFAAISFAPGAPTASLSMPHLEGQTVSAWTSEGVANGLVVGAGGAVTLPWPVAWAIIGLFDVTHYVELLDVTAQAQDGNTMGRLKRFHDKGGIGLHATAQLRVAAVERKFGKPATVKPGADLVQRQVGTPGADLFSGVVGLAPPSDPATELSYRFTPVGGAPATLTAIVPFVQEAGR